MGSSEFCKALNICMNMAEIENATLAKEAKVSSTLVSAWRSETRKFRTVYLKDACKCVTNSISELHEKSQRAIKNSLLENVNIDFAFHEDAEISTEIGSFLASAFHYDEQTKRSINVNVDEKQNNHESVPIIKRNRKCAVVFDFDGTLTKKKELNSIWETIWEKLGYTRDDCRYYHSLFDDKKITHQEWCDITCEHFQKRQFRCETLDELTQGITLLHNTDKLFMELRKRNIDIYIISGSIIRVIKTVLGELNTYVNDIRANDMLFTQEGLLEKIVGTKYDFEGKAEYIRSVLAAKTISPQDVLFVGNSNNDEYVKSSGATTLCINPAQTNFHDRSKWDRTILNCTDATMILDELY